MLYTSGGEKFEHHIHTTLRRRIRTFLILALVMLLIVFLDITRGQLSMAWAAAGVAIGGVVGVLTSRIFHISWDRDAKRVIGRVDTLGFVFIGLYAAFEIGRTVLFETLIHTSFPASAIAFAFVSGALIGRVLGMRGRILRVLKEEKVFG